MCLQSDNEKNALPSRLNVSHNPGDVLALHLEVVTGSVGLELAGAGVVGDPEAVAALVEVEGGVPVQGDPVVMAAHPIRKCTLLVTSVN